MILVRIFRFLRGYVEFEVWGGFAERFLNLCGRMEIDLWAVRRIDDRLIARVDAHAYRRLHRPAHRSGMRLHARLRRGVPFLCVRYRRRAGAVVGICAALVMVAAMAPFIWTVQVQGASPATEREVLRAFEELGVHSGVRAGSVDVDAVVLKAYGKLPELSWMALNIRGCSAVIEVREKVPVPEIADDKTPCNVVAERDGQIIRIQPYAGSVQADAGSAVVRGDLLISGAVERKDGGVTFVHAQGDVYARTKRTIEIRVPCQAEGNVQEELGSSYRFGAFFLSVPLGKQQSGEGVFSRVERRQLEIGGVALPVFWEHTTYYHTCPADFTYTQEEAFMLAVTRFAEALEQLEREAAVIGGAPKVELSEQGCRITAVFDCEENISSQEPIDLESSSVLEKDPQ